MSQLLRQNNGSNVLPEPHKAVILLVASNSTSSPPTGSQALMSNTELASTSKKQLFSPVLKHVESCPSLCLSFLFLEAHLSNVHCIGKKWKPLLSSFFFVSICCFIMICTVLLFPLWKLRPPAPRLLLHTTPVPYTVDRCWTHFLFWDSISLELGISEVRKKLLLLNQYTAFFFFFVFFFLRQPHIGRSVKLNSQLYLHPWGCRVLKNNSNLASKERYLLGCEDIWSLQAKAE